MVHTNVVLNVTDEADVPQVRELLREHARLSRAEPGCLRFDLYHSQADRKVFILVECWESPEALDVHRTAKGYTEIYKPQVLPRATRVAHVSDLLE